jgi:hypothetical protein
MAHSLFFVYAARASPVPALQKMTATISSHAIYISVYSSTYPPPMPLKLIIAIIVIMWLIVRSRSHEARLRRLENRLRRQRQDLLEIARLLDTTQDLIEPLETGQSLDHARIAALTATHRNTIANLHERIYGQEQIIDVIRRRRVHDDIIVITREIDHNDAVIAMLRREAEHQV